MAENSSKTGNLHSVTTVNTVVRWGLCPCFRAALAGFCAIICPSLIQVKNPYEASYAAF